MLKSIAALFLFCAAADAVEVRVASLNVGALYVSGGPIYGLGDPGTPGYEATKSVLQRINAQVVALQEIHNADIDDEPTGTPEDVEVLAAALGYPYIYNPPRTSLDFTFRVIFLSKYPFLTSTSIGSPSPANEITRRFPAVKVNIPGTDNDPLIISGHLKSGTTTTDRFRRAIEMRRLNEFIVASNLTADSNFVVLGDFNLSSSNRTFTEAPTDLPGSYVLGSDVTFPVTYSTNPLAYFSPTVPTRVDLRQVNNSTATYQSGSSIDIMLLSPAFAGRPVASEIYNSELDTSNSVGLPKTGAPLAANTSSTASDHYAIFADLELDQDFPNLDLTVTPSSVAETSASGTAKLRVTIPASRVSDLTVALSSDNPAVARTTQSSVVIPAGSLFAEVPIETSRNFLADEGNNVAFTGTATNYDPDSAVLLVVDTDGSYTFTAVNQTITEPFTGFDGTHDPAPWITDGNLPWLGTDDGSLVSPGFRSYGSAGNPSAGYFPDPANTASSTFSATFRNQSGQPLTALAISLDATVWRTGSVADRLTAAVVTPTATYSVPALTFAPLPSLPAGPVSNPSDTPLAATVDGLSIPPGGTFDLRFNFEPGAGGGVLPSDVFINEFHYDNASTDENEFVEIVVGPGYTGPLSDLRLYLYNGANGAVYDSTTYTLDTFTLGTTTSSGHRVFHRMIPGIQNGNPDGFAVTQGNNVLHFISYGGTFTATNGPALDMTSVNIGFTQATNTPVNTNSIRLIGTGGKASDFAWTKTAIAHSPGAVNSGQTFTAPAQHNAIAIDDISVTFLPPDVDSDHDGYSDRIEQNLLLTNPADPGSRFTPTESFLTPSTSRLSFPTLSGRKYVIQESPDLSEWTDVATYSGNGLIRTTDFPVTPEDPKMFHRVVITFE